MNEFRGALWFIRGSLCRWLGHSDVTTDPTWSDIMGSRICRYCYRPDPTAETGTAAEASDA